MSIRIGSGHDEWSPAGRAVTEDVKAILRGTDSIFQTDRFIDSLTPDAVRALKNVSPANHERARSAASGEAFWNVVREDKAAAEHKTRSPNAVARPVTSERPMRDVAMEVAAEMGYRAPTAMEATPGGCMPEGSWRTTPIDWHGIRGT